MATWIPDLAPRRLTSTAVSPYVSVSLDDPTMRWRMASPQYDFMRNVFMPSLGLEGLALGAIPIPQITSLDQIVTYAKEASSAVARTPRPDTYERAAAYDSAARAYQIVAVQAEKVSASPPGGSWERDEYTAQLDLFRDQLTAADRQFDIAKGKPAAIGPVVTPSGYTTPISPIPPSPEPSRLSLLLTGTAGKALIGAGAVLVLATVYNRFVKRTNPRRRRRGRRR